MNYKIRKRHAFTLVELLLVVAILGIVAAVTMPNLARSVKGNRIRVATRSVISAGRYARNISILRGMEHALLFDLDGGGIYVSGGVVEMPTNTVAKVDDMDGSVFDDNTASNLMFVADRAFSGSSEFGRKLDGVKIESLELSGGLKFIKGRQAVVFESNGRCTPYVVTLEDETGKMVIIKVDALACVETEEKL